MTQEKLEQRAWKFVAADKSRIPVTSLQTSIELCRAELQKAAEIADKFDSNDGKLIGAGIRKLMD